LVLLETLVPQHATDLLIYFRFALPHQYLELRAVRLKIEPLRGRITEHLLADHSTLGHELIERRRLLFTHIHLLHKTSVGIGHYALRHASCELLDLGVVE